MKRKMIIRCALVGAAALVVAACFGDENDPTTKYEGNYLIHYEPDNAYEEDEFINNFFPTGDTVSVNKYLSIGPMTHYAAITDDGVFEGGFALCRGKDVDASPERKPSRFAVYDEKGGYGGSLAYAVFHDTLSTLMPEHAIAFYIPNNESNCAPKSVYVHNVQAVVQAVKYGVGLEGGPFGADDYLVLTLTGSLKGKAGTPVTVKLVDGTSFVSEWKEVDLSKMEYVDAVDLHLESSRPDLPLYCCMENFGFHYLEIYR